MCNLLTDDLYHAITIQACRGVHVHPPLRLNFYKQQCLEWCLEIVTN